MEPDNRPDDGPDQYQQAWQKHSTQTRITIDTELLQKEVQRSQRAFRTTIFHRDFREVVVALMLLPYWFYMGITKSLPWTWWLVVPALVWIAGFMLVYRMRHKQEPSKTEDSLRDCVQRSLTEQEDQIWLLDNIFWWYLLTPMIPILAFFAQVSWSLRSQGWLEALGFFVGLVFVLAMVYGFVYWLNKRCVRVSLEPRRQELLTLLASLGDESTVEYIAMRQAKSEESSRTLRRWMIVVAIVSCLVIFPLIVLDVELPVSKYDGPPRSSGPAGDSLAKLITDQRKDKKFVGLTPSTISSQTHPFTKNGNRSRSNNC
ncbi:MAG: hypothetical protein SGI77_21010 [Pirellulaceae bacterium]|nr:hypothetical protein [Pirellulaceae bacterium]